MDLQTLAQILVCIALVVTSAVLRWLQFQARERAWTELEQAVGDLRKNARPIKEDR